PAPATGRGRGPRRPPLVSLAYRPKRRLGAARRTRRPPHPERERRILASWRPRLGVCGAACPHLPVARGASGRVSWDWTDSSRGGRAYHVPLHRRARARDAGQGGAAVRLHLARTDAPRAGHWALASARSLVGVIGGG